MRDLSDQIGLSYGYLGKIERGDVQPPKETVILIAEKIGESPYDLLVAANYSVNIEKDIPVEDLHWTDEQVTVEMMRYRIYPHHLLNEKIKERRYLKFTLHIELNNTKERVQQIMAGYHVSLQEAVSLCHLLEDKFCELFFVKPVQNIRFIGQRKNEEVALQIHKYVEKQLDNWKKKEQVERDSIKYSSLKFGDFLHVITLKEGYKDIYELAERAGINFKVVEKVASNDGSPDFETIRELSNGFSTVTYEELLSKAGFNYIEDVLNEVAVSKEVAGVQHVDPFADCTADEVEYLLKQLDIYRSIRRSHF